MKTLLTWAAAVFGIFAAILWFTATVVRLEHREVRDEAGTFPAAIVRVEGTRRIDVLATADRQTWWNMWAALATGIAAVCQSVSLLL